MLALKLSGEHLSLKNSRKSPCGYFQTIDMISNFRYKLLDDRLHNLGGQFGMVKWPC